MDLQTLWTIFISTYGVYIGGLVLLIAADLILGIASALKRKVFDWQVVSNFYRTNIIPKLLGWVAVTLLAYAASGPVGQLLGPTVGQYFGPAAANGFYLAVVGSLLASIYSNYQEIQKPVEPGAK